MSVGLRVVDAMTVRPVVAGPRTSIADVAALMDRYDVGTIAVRQGDELLGVVNESDIVRRGILEGHEMRTTPIVRIMTRDLITVTPGMDLLDVVVLMKDTDVHTLPVVDDGKMVGFITVNDILKLRPDFFETIAESIQLREEERKLMRKKYLSNSLIEDD